MKNVSRRFSDGYISNNLRKFAVKKIEQQQQQPKKTQNTLHSRIHILTECSLCGKISKIYSDK